MASGLFKSFQNFFSRSSEEATEEVLDEFVDPADVSFTPTDVTGTKVYSVDPSIEGGDIPFFQRERDTKDVIHEEFQYRLEHEPYRFEPDSDMTVCVTKAHLYEIHPTTNSVNIHELTPLTIKVTDNCVVYSQFDTNNHGAILEGSHYQLLKKDGDEVPASTQFILPDEGAGLTGSGGTYNIPLFWIKNRKLYRNFWDNTVDPHRQTQLMGGLDGHRGPLWWIKGYNCLRNIGTGKNIYKDYTIADDFKNLRTLKEKGQEHDSATFPIGDPPDRDAPFTGDPQVQVEKSAGGDEIEIYGNRFNKHWKIGGFGVGIVEDGLVTCLTDLACHTLTNRTLTPVSVLTSATTTAVVNDVTTQGGSAASATPASTATVLTSGGTTDDVWRGGTTNATMWQGGQVQSNMRQGGAHKDLAWHCVEGCGSTGDVWALGVPKSGSYSGGPPPTVTALCDTVTVTGIKDAAHATGITGASHIDDVVTSTGTATAITGLTPLTVITSVSHTDFTVVSGASGSVSVYQAHASDHKFLTPPSSSNLSVVACPVAHTCPPE
tara:strand:+ start:3171 stop:4811 length:1641 start_codon:yes stop_codon:yes gene_type:complete